MARFSITVSRRTYWSTGSVTVQPCCTQREHSVEYRSHSIMSAIFSSVTSGLWWLTKFLGFSQAGSVLRYWGIHLQRMPCFEVVLGSIKQLLCEKKLLPIIKFSSCPGSKPSPLNDHREVYAFLLLTWSSLQRFHRHELGRNEAAHNGIYRSLNRCEAFSLVLACFLRH